MIDPCRMSEFAVDWTEMCPKKVEAVLSGHHSPDGLLTLHWEKDRFSCLKVGLLVWVDNQIYFVVKWVVHDENTEDASATVTLRKATPNAYVFGVDHG